MIFIMQRTKPLEPLGPRKVIKQRHSSLQGNFLHMLQPRIVINYVHADAASAIRTRPNLAAHLNIIIRPDASDYCDDKLAVNTFITPHEQRH